MDTQALYALRDVAGVPSHPAIFMVLSVLTFALHIAAVHLALGASGLTVWGALSKQAYRRRLAQSMLPVSKFMISLAVFLGVAPLLFVQVIYDPFWYTSNVLSAWWVIGFIATLTVAALLNMFFVVKNHHIATRKTVCPGAMILSTILLLVVGFIMHTLTNQMLSPEKWMAWYAPNGVVDTSGRSLHDFHLPRYLFHISLSVPVVGALLVGYGRYLHSRLDDEEHDITPDYLAWAGGLGYRLILVGGVISVAIGAWWMATLPEKAADFAISIWPMLALAWLLLFVGFSRWVKSTRMSSNWAYSVLGFGLVALIVVATAREALRWTIINGVHGYNALDYAINMDWYSTITFFVTFVLIGGTVMTYIASVAWNAGKVKGIYTPGPAIDNIGTAAIWLSTLWVVHFFMVGFYIWWV